MKPFRILLISLTALMMLIGFERGALGVSLPLDQMAVPRYDVWGPLPSAVKQQLRLLVDEPQEEIDRLLSSPDPREVGLGLFALEQRADLGRLVTLVDLIDDPRPTIPYAEYRVARNDMFIPKAQTVGEYLLQIYREWISLYPEEEVRARKEEIRAMNPWDRPGPWLQKMTRASRGERFWNDNSEARDQRIAQLKLEVRQIPSGVRWAVILNGLGYHGFYSAEEARSELLLLDQSVHDQIMTGDPLTQHAGQIGWDVEKDLSAKARELLIG